MDFSFKKNQPMLFNWSWSIHLLTICLIRISIYQQHYSTNIFWLFCNIFWNIWLLALLLAFHTTLYIWNITKTEKYNFYRGCIYIPICNDNYKLMQFIFFFFFRRNLLITFRLWNHIFDIGSIEDESFHSDETIYLRCSHIMLLFAPALEGFQHKKWIAINNWYSDDVFIRLGY